MPSKPSVTEECETTRPIQSEQKRSWIQAIVNRLAQKLSRISPDRLSQLVTAPDLALVPKSIPARRPKATPQEPLRSFHRPIEGQSKPMMRIAIVNHKGGVGKTSTAINLSAALAQMGYKVLVFDCDSQGDLSAVYVPGADKLPQSIANLFDNTAFVEQLVRETQYPNVSVVPADERLNLVDKTHGFENDANATCLAHAVAGLSGNYDYIIFDCPPRPHLTAFAALCAATHVVIPCEPSQFSVRSMVRLMDEIELARRTFNPGLHLLGYFLSKVAARSKTQDTYRQMLVEAFGEHLVLKTVIPVQSTFEAAINMRKPVVYYRPKSKASQIMKQFALELIGVTHEQRSRSAA